MIESVHYKNFKVLRDATLPLSQFTLIVGPNGSGKSTALQGLSLVANRSPVEHRSIASLGVSRNTNSETIITVSASFANHRCSVAMRWTASALPSGKVSGDDQAAQQLRDALAGLRVYNLDATRIASSVALMPNATLESNGGNLAIVLDRLRDQDPERFDALNAEFARWLPEYDRILFDTPAQGQRSFALRLSGGLGSLSASQLSQGTLLALAILTVAYLAEPPTIVCLEEPDRGIHPRLLRQVQDALYRLSYPKDFGEKRPSVQVIATTHSPYMLDLFKDHPEEVVIAQKAGTEATFERLSDRSDLDEILRDSHLGDAWYSGILGGVPVNS